MATINSVLVDASQATAVEPRASPDWDLSGFEHPELEETQQTQEDGQNQASTKRRADRRFFTYEEDELIIDELLEVAKTSTTQGGFKPGVYGDITAKLRSKARTENRELPTLVQVKNRIGRLKNDFWDPINFLVSRSGWDWDETEHRVLQYDKSCWDAVIKINPKCRQWETRSWPLYYKAHSLFEGTKATGESVVDPKAPRQAPKRGSSKKRKAATLEQEDDLPPVDWSILSSIPGLSSTPSPADDTDGSQAVRRKLPVPVTPSPAGNKGLVVALEGFTAAINNFNLTSSPSSDSMGGGVVVSSRRALLSEVADAEYLEREEKVQLLRWATTLDMDVADFVVSMTDPVVKQEFIRSHLPK